MPYKNLHDSWIIQPRYIPYLSSNHPIDNLDEKNTNLGKYDNISQNTYTLSNNFLGKHHYTFNIGGYSPYDINCNHENDCPLGMKCINGKCKREECHSDMDSSSGACLNTPDYNIPYKSKLYECQLNSDCFSNNCLNTENYYPDNNGNYFCGRHKGYNLVDSIAIRYNQINPRYKHN